MTHPEPTQHPDDAYVNGIAEGMERAAKIIEGGSFLHKDAPVAQWAREASAAIRREIKHDDPTPQPTLDAVARTKTDPNRSLREDELVAEIERLRAENAALIHDNATLYECWTAECNR